MFHSTQHYKVVTICIYIVLHKCTLKATVNPPVSYQGLSGEEAGVVVQKLGC